MVGGVSSNSIIRQHLEKRLNKLDSSIRLFFANPDLSKDNAVGVALLGLKKYNADYQIT